MIRTHFYPIFIGLFGIYSTVTHSQPMSWNGRVLDESGKPLAGCTIFLKSSPSIGATTNAGGLFEIVNGTSAVKFAFARHAAEGQFASKTYFGESVEKDRLRDWRSLAGRSLEKEKAHFTPRFAVSTTTSNSLRQSQPLIKNAALFDSLLFDCPDRPYASRAISGSSGAVGDVVVKAIRKPNVVIFISDDLSYHDIGVYGSQDSKTPAIDALAKQGWLFRNAYTATAMCVPTRSMLYTGLFPVKSGAFPNHSRVKPGVKSIVQYLTDLGYRVGLAGKLDVYPATAFPFQAVGSQSSIDFKAVRSFVNSDTNQPYCIVLASHHPHEPWPRVNPLKLDPKALHLPPYLYASDTTRTYVVDYLNEVNNLDTDVDSSLAIINASKQVNNTAFFFLSEQGSSLPGAKWTCYEPGIKVGMILRWPEYIKPGKVTDIKLEYPDILPTLIAAAGGNPIPGLDGKSFLGALLGKTEIHREYIYGVHTQLGAIGTPPTGYPVRSIRKDKYKFIMNLNHTVTFSDAVTDAPVLTSWKQASASNATAKKLVDRYLNRPAEELYDLESDPWEMVNLITNPGLKSIADSLRSQLQAWMQEQGDLGEATELDAPNHHN